MNIQEDEKKQLVRIVRCEKSEMLPSIDLFQSNTQQSIVMAYTTAKKGILNVNLLKYGVDDEFEISKQSIERIKIS